MSDLDFVIAAYSITWIVVIGYALVLAARIRRAGVRLGVAKGAS